MLYAQLDKNGTLLIRATDGIEMYALKFWETQYKAGKSSLKIECEEITSVSESMKEFLRMIGKDIEEFRKWQHEQKESFPKSEIK